LTTYPEIPFQFFLDLLHHTTTQTVIDRLATNNITTTINESSWQTLQGGMEHNVRESGILSVHGLSAVFSIELMRSSKDPARQWINGFVLTPKNLPAGTCASRVRGVIENFFRLTERVGDGTEYYRGEHGTECALLPETENVPCRLLLYRKTKIRQPRD